MANEVQLRICEDIPQTKPVIKFKSKYLKWKYDADYKKAETGKSCKNCRNCIGFKYHDKTYYKCNLQGISHGAATDIRLSYVCNYHREVENV